MLFNSYIFIFAFLPITLVGFYGLNRIAGFRVATFWVILASLIFYGWWNPALLALLVGSIIVNVALGRHLINGQGSRILRKSILTAGIIFNLGLLGYFKYAGFIIENLDDIFATDFTLGKIILPIAISFYTFQQIAFLVDAYRNLVTDFSISRYFLFVTFFPQLIAGPIVHHHEMMPQYSKLEGSRFNPENLSIGVTMFAIGLFKKVVFADYSAHWADPLFQGAADGLVLTMAEAWVASLAFTFQIYFDFSGYSDMAIGLGWMFGLILPLNFYSPYKATSIIDFWRRWHMTLSRFLRDYLYLPLGGSRHGKVRRYVNLGIVMLLGGLWHGAAWTYVAWGALHGVYLIINHAWRAVTQGFAWADQEAGRLQIVAFRAVTFVAVVFSWVLFRAADFSSALSILKSMVGLNGLSLGEKSAALFGGYTEMLTEYGIVFQGLFSNGIMPDRDFVGIWIVMLIVFVMTAPSTNELIPGASGTGATASRDGGSAPSRLIWSSRLAWGCATGVLVFISLQQFSKITPFLYFQF